MIKGYQQPDCTKLNCCKPSPHTQLSITLTLATLGMVHVPAAPTEAIIALSILFPASEIIHKHNGQISLKERYPWMIAFFFCLFHGLGFAGALS